MRKDPRSRKASAGAGATPLLAQAISAYRAHNYFEAHRLCAGVIEKDKKNTVALHLFGILEALQKNTESALWFFDRALKISPHNADILADKGRLLTELGQHQDALHCYQQAVSISPEHGIALHNSGCTLLALNRPAEALDVFDRLLKIDACYPPALKNRGVALKELSRFEEAVASYKQAILLNPQDMEAWCNIGDVFLKLKCYDEAFAAYNKTLELKPDLAEAWLGRGNVYNELNRYGEALADYDTALSLKPELPTVARLHAKMQICDWSGYDDECEHVISSVRNGNVSASPFVMLSIPSSSDDLLQCAKLWVSKNYPLSRRPMWRGERYNHHRIRLAYLSADFRQHPVATLTAGMFECHDKSHFDVTAISIGPDDNSEMRQRLKASFDRFVDAEKYSDDQIATLIKELEIDILVDLMGFTAMSRTGILAWRCAPIQINYLGYSGTMGAQYIDYVIADRIVIPEEKRKCHTEKTICLPDSFLGNDSKRKISERIPSRSECGLPETGFVFCSFGNYYKIAPKMFDIWMRLLRRLDDSVLWLSGTNETAIRNLRREAENRGIDSSRLVFARRVPLVEDHLARYQLANLFVDVLPYNAHTTASDALWAGLPVLTLIGESFAGRVAASLLNAIDMPELVTTTPEAYEQMAIELATHPQKLAEIKQRLAHNRLKTPLFDTKLFTQHIEAAYIATYERHQAGLAPDHIVIAGLRSGKCQGGIVASGNL